VEVALTFDEAGGGCQSFCVVFELLESFQLYNLDRSLLVGVVCAESTYFIKHIL